VSSLKARYWETAKHALVFGLGSLGNKLIAFLLLPLYTSYLTTADYGVLAVLNAADALLTIVLHMGLSTSIFKFYYSDEEAESRRLIISTSLFWLVGIGVIVLIAALSLAHPLARVLLHTSAYAQHVRLLLAADAFTIVKIIPLCCFRARKQSAKYACFSLVEFLTTTALNILFVAYARMGILGILRASLITAIVFSVLGVVLCRADLTLSFSWARLKALLRYGLPLVPSLLSAYVLVQSDRFFLQRFVPMSDVGLYSLGYQFGMLINLLVVQPFQLVWLPTAFEMEHRPRARDFYQGMLTYILLLGSWFALGLSLLGKDVIALVTSKSFHSAYVVIPWVACSYVMYAGYMVVNIGIYLRSKTHYAMWIVGAAALFNLTLNLVLIPSFGILGAAAATLLSYTLLFVVAWQVNRRFFPLSYEWGRVAKLGAVAAVVFFVGQNIIWEGLPAILVKVLLLILFWGLLLLSRFFNSNEIAMIQKVGGSLVRRTFRTRSTY